MVLIQLLLPATDSRRGGAHDDTAAFARTRQELAARFEGLTNGYLRSPAKGLWTAPGGHTEEDDVVMVEVVTDTFDRPCGAPTRSPWRTVSGRTRFTCGLCRCRCWLRTHEYTTGDRHWRVIADFDAMMRGDGDVVSGWKNKLQHANCVRPPSVLRSLTGLFSIAAADRCSDR